jgi:hypothetical protein
MKSLADRARELLREQKSEWDLLKRGYESLASVRTRTFQFDGFEVKLQFNPGRFASSAARVDDKSIRERKCFLCDANRPKEQRGLDCGGGYTLLCNPFPIFPEHFTIAHREHRPQRILDCFGDMLRLARDLSDGYCVFYNGPRSGASAPDHLHLQAGNKNFMPIDTDLHKVAFDRYLRRYFYFESCEEDYLIDGLTRVCSAMQSVTACTDEPMMNVIAYYGVPKAGWWRTVIFPRGKHRPAAYFAEGDAELLLSPGTVDMGGVLIVVREHDFERITREDVARIYDEVTLPATQFDAVAEMI